MLIYINKMEYKKYKDITYRIIGAAMTVHRELGSGLLEPIYNEALCMELTDIGLQAEPEQEVFCYYKGRKLEKTYRMDILVENDIVLELKSTEEICAEHRFQLFNYRRLTKKPIGLLINFGSDSLYGERYGYDSQTNECILLSKEMTPYY